MGSFKGFNQRTGRLATLAALVTATLVQGLVPVFASADQVTSRSVALSSSVKSSTNVTYNVSFTTSTTTPTTATAFVVQFCSNTPLIGQTCTAPSGMTAASVTTATAGASISTTTVATANKVVVDKAGMTPGSAVSVELAGITNPSTAGPLYARIATYDTDAHAANYSTDGATLGAGQVDSGSVAISITDGVAVSGAVLESMTFCVSGTSIAASCDLADGGSLLTAPTLTLGENVGGVVALSSTAVSTGTIYTQMSTNAAGGAIVSLKSNAASSCGGLMLAGSVTCYIPASGIAANTVVAGTAGFGVKTGADVTGSDGDYKASTNYNSTTYHMDATGVTGTYGDPILNTAGAPANNLNMPLTFGVSIGNNTPAGKYSADLNLIATGTF